MQFWSALEPYIERGESAVVVLVAQSTRHSPGTTGARMFVTQGGVQHGTIGGGAMEADIKRAAHRLLVGRRETHPSASTLVHRASGQGQRSGLICAGSQTNVTWVVTPDMVSDIATLADFERDDRPGRLAITANGHEVGEGPFDTRHGPVTWVAGDAWRYCETVFNFKRATIVGGGHCGLALSRTLQDLGYHVSLFDVRADCPTVAENVWADVIQIVDDYASVAAAIRHSALQHVVVMTADFWSDVRALEGLARRPEIPFVGLMGSPAKLHKIFATLRERGVEQGFIETLHAPVGLRIKSNTPQEIAVSVAAQLLSVRETLFPYSKWPEVDDVG